MWWLIAGPIGGFLAGWFLKGDKKFDLIDVVIGLLGGGLCGWLFTWAVGTTLIGQIISAFLGSLVLVWLYEKFSGRKVDM